MCDATVCDRRGPITRLLKPNQLNQIKSKVAVFGDIEAVLFSCSNRLTEEVSIPPGTGLFLLMPSRHLESIRSDLTAIST